MKKGILFSGTKDNVASTYDHLKEHGVVYWCMPVNVHYKTMRFPITGLLHVKNKGIQYVCTITDILPFSKTLVQDGKKKPITWLEQWNMDRKNYKVIFIISQMKPCAIRLNQLKCVNGEKVKQPPQGYVNIVLPK